MASKSVTYWKIYRIVFIVFFLYLLGDVIYRWEGIRHYSS